MHKRNGAAVLTLLLSMQIPFSRCSRNCPFHARTFSCYRNSSTFSLMTILTYIFEETIAGGQCNFNQHASCLGFSSFKPLNELHDLTKGYLVNDTMVVDAEIRVIKATPPVGSLLSPPQFSS